MQIETAELKRALETVVKATGKNAMMPILSHILVEKRGKRLHLTATDLELRIEDSVQVGGDEDDFSICVLADTFTKHVSRFTKDEVIATLTEEFLILKAGVTAKVPVSAPDDFPVAVDTFDNSLYFAQASDVLDALRRLPFYSANKARPLMNSIHMRQLGDKLMLVAMDGYVFGDARIPMTAGEALNGYLNASGDALKAVVSALGKLDGSDIQIEYGPSQARFTAATTRVTIRMVVGGYPDHIKLYPKQLENEFSVDAKALHALVDQASISADDQRKHVKIEVMPAFMILRSESSSGSLHNEDDPLPLERAGDCEEIKPETMTFSIPYLLQAVKVLQGMSDRVVFRKDPTRPFVTLEAEGVRDYAIGLCGMKGD